MNKISARTEPRKPLKGGQSIMLRVSEVVTIDIIKNWVTGETVTIKAATGAGKSYFIKNNLCALSKLEGKRILLLTHRSNCKTQFTEEIMRDKKAAVIEIATYQKLEYNFMHDNNYDLSQYKYIVCDEFHYFMSDASFSKTTDISLDIVLNRSPLATKIFMSATGDYMKKYLHKVKRIETIDYELPITYEFIEKLTFYNTDKVLENFMEERINKGEKAILFLQSATKAHELFKKYKDHCLFNCSKSNPHYKYVEPKKVRDMLPKEHFDALILISTTCLDTGVNIIDLELKHILCDVEDTGTIIQCIGRKRIQSLTDKVHVYIKTISNRSLSGKHALLSKKIAMAEFLKKHSVKEFLEKYKREHDVNDMVYDEVVAEENRGTKKVNDLMFFKARIDMFEIGQILNGQGYCEYMKGVFGMGRFNIIEKDDKETELSEYMQGIAGKRLLKAGQKELAIAMDIKDSRGRVQKSISLLNAYFMENSMKFMIRAGIDSVRKLPDGSPNPQRNKAYWVVYELNSIPYCTNDDTLNE